MQIWLGSRSAFLANTSSCDSRIKNNCEGSVRFGLWGVEIGQKCPWHCFGTIFLLVHPWASTLPQVELFALPSSNDTRQTPSSTDPAAQGWRRSGVVFRELWVRLFVWWGWGETLCSSFVVFELEDLWEKESMERCTTVVAYGNFQSQMWFKSVFRPITDSDSTSIQRHTGWLIFGRELSLHQCKT